jgi:hypothetical protein
MNFKIKGCGVALLVMIGCVARAQQVSLTDNEVKALKDSIQVSEAYQKVFKPIEAVAQKALNESPNPIEKIRSQGLLQGDPLKTATNLAIRDVSKIYALALNYRLTNDKRYLEKATAYLLAWANTNKATGDPIDETKLEEVIVGYDLLRNLFEQKNRNTMDAWLASIADEELDSFSIKGGRKTAINNWNSHRVKIITLIAYTLHSKKYQESATRELEKQIAQNLNPDGSTYDFHERDALHYHIYSLEPLLKAVIAINRANNKNYFTYTSAKGSSIKKSVDFLVPFVTGETKHQEFLNSTVPFDKARAKNGEKGYIVADFVPSHGIIVLALADYFSPDYMNVIQQVKGKAGRYFDLQLALNQIKRTTIKTSK